MSGGRIEQDTGPGGRRWYQLIQNQYYTMDKLKAENVPGDQLSDAKEGILEDQPGNATLVFVGSDKVDCHSSSKTLSIYDNP